MTANRAILDVTVLAELVRSAQPPTLLDVRWTLAELQAAPRKLGVRVGHPVMVYDAGGPNPTGAAARAWWALRERGVAATLYGDSRSHRVAKGVAA